MCGANRNQTVPPRVTAAARTSGACVDTVPLRMVATTGPVIQMSS